MSETTRRHVYMFWQLVDEVLNAVLFLMLGLEATRLHVSLGLAIIAAVAGPVVLRARLVSVAGSAIVLRPFMKLPSNPVWKLSTRLTLPVALVPVWPRPVMNSPSWNVLPGCTVPLVCSGWVPLLPSCAWICGDRKALSL